MSREPAFKGKVAIPIFRSRVAPVFDYCVRVSVFDIGGDGQTERSELYLGTLSPIERVGALIKEGVTTLVCGGMSEDLDKLFQTSGISVIGSIGGPVEGVLEAFMSDRLDEPQYRSPGIVGEKYAPPQDRSEPARHVGSVESIQVSAGRQPLTRAVTACQVKPNMRILLVEKDIASQKTALHLLERSGCEVDTVMNAREALRALEKAPYDLVFMDAEMPEIDGYGTTRLIRDPRSKIRNHHVPVIAMTAHATEGDRKRCIEAGMNDCIAKPIQPESFLEVIGLVLPNPPMKSH
jgi:CheY-like chemotaxis protein/predicted Fe-Mo cluster-binding NifX family protein